MIVFDHVCKTYPNGVKGLDDVSLKIGQGEFVGIIGLSGAGKSTLGVVLAKILGMDFVDGDILIQNQVGNTLQKIIDAQGVDGFLQVENDVLAAVDVQNMVISTGG